MIGPVVIQKTAECLRKIRNSARFMLGNLPDPVYLDLKPQINEMNIVSRINFVFPS